MRIFIFSILKVGTDRQTEETLLTLCAPIAVHLQPDGLREGQRQPAHRGLYRSVPRPGGAGGKDVGHLQRALAQGK